MTHLTNSILPAVLLHTGGNLYSNTDLWMHGQAEWQASAGPATLIWQTGADASFWGRPYATVWSRQSRPL